jgi:hypothetical protein
MNLAAELQGLSVSMQCAASGWPGLKVMRSLRRVSILAHYS